MILFIIYQFGVEWNSEEFLPIFRHLCTASFRFLWLFLHASKDSALFKHHRAQLGPGFWAGAGGLSDPAGSVLHGEPRGQGWIDREERSRGNTHYTATSLVIILECMNLNEAVHWCICIDLEFPNLLILLTICEDEKYWFLNKT